MSERTYVTPVGDTGMYILDTAAWRVYRPVMDKSRCIHCGLCFSYCPVNAIQADGKDYTITYDYCKGCGICAHECPKEAISMQLEGSVKANG
ncbi:4Fe-4S binding protein [Megasphaera hominis]|jgi:pyruvate ferredoxin oxidoreductase delta subunit|uniref:4Fe-4S binding protein n=2 Tax=Megasphaera TaxID=906 RepID=A0ABR6VIJ4_9FIRM|nr:4Fe-4S binding protein [Megasphaera hominis]MBC3537034.1 4Fe-4S binding protein [Megasphaera hominis]